MQATNGGDRQLRQAKPGQAWPSLAKTRQLARVADHVSTAMFCQIDKKSSIPDKSIEMKQCRQDIATLCTTSIGITNLLSVRVV